MVRSNQYAIFVFTIIMPLNGAIMARGGWWTVVGLVLCLTQLPWFLQSVLDRRV